MPIVVQKYGGSSVSSIEKLRQVAEQVAATRKRGLDVVVVVSAMGKSTQQLIEMARQASHTGPGTHQQAPKRELDMLLSTGERVSMSLLSMVLSARGVPAVSLTGSQSGILTNDQHYNARIIEIRPHRIEDELQRGRVVIVAGYQGMSYRREVTTLGRGGSDTTAVALTAALGAERCEIYSDVDGVYTADPRRVESARHIPELNYEMMQEIAETGARVLNAEAVQWARENGVVVLARRTGHSPKSDFRQTRVTARLKEPVRAIVSDPSVLVAECEHNDLPRLLGFVVERDLTVRAVASRDRASALVLSLSNEPDPEAIVGELRALRDAPRLHRGLAALSLVGPPAESPALTLQHALKLTDQTPFLLQQLPLRMTWFVAAETLPTLESLWHAKFVLEPISAAPAILLPPHDTSSAAFHHTATA